MHIKIESKLKGAHTRVWLDGREITGWVRVARMSWKVGHVNQVYLELLPDELEIETEGYAAKITDIDGEI